MRLNVESAAAPEDECTSHPSTAATSSKGFFRCPVHSECGDASIRIGRRRTNATISEASIDGFTVLIESVDADRLRLGILWTLFYDDAIFEVHPQWLFHAPDGNVQVGLRRLRDLTPEPTIGRRRFRWIGRNGHHTVGQFDDGPPVMLFGSLFLIAAVTLPFTGDALGTRAPIQNGVRHITQMIGSWLS
ncbi:MAG: hypothetical protein AAGJ40_21565 [Planctomycetota bacterium]